MKKKTLFAVSVVIVIAAIIFTYRYYTKDKEPEVSMFDVGVEGGEFSTEDNGIRLIIPAQAAEQATDIFVSTDNTIEKMGPNQASSLYTISGLQRFSKPVTIQIKTTAPLAGETYVALGGSAYVHSLGEWTTGFEYISCSIKDNMVEFVFEPSKIESAMEEVSRRSPLSPKLAYAADEPTTEEIAIEVAVITNQQSTLSNDNRFNVIASVTITPEERQQIINSLNHSYQFFAQMGFDQSYASKSGIELLGYSLIDPPNWPLDIYVKELGGGDQNVAAYWIESWRTKDGWIEINASMIQDKKEEELNSSIIHEYFHFVQYLYNSKNEWFDEATATWAEEFALGRQGSFNPENYRTYGTMNYQILDGPINHLGRGAREHGYGCWSFIKFLVNTPAQGGELVKVYQNIAKYNSELQCLNAIRPLKEWINQFYVTHLTPGGPVPGGIALTEFHQTAPVVTINLADSGNAVAPEQAVTIPGLGARVVLVKLDATNANNITDSTSLEVRSDNDDCTVNLLRISTHMFEVLATSPNVASTNRVATIAKDKWPEQIMVLVTNTSEQNVACNLEFNIKAEKPFEVWELQHKFQDQADGWIGPNVLLYRNEQGQFYKMEQDLRYLSDGAKHEYGFKMEGNRVIITDYNNPNSTIYDIYEGTLSADGKSIIGTMVTRKKADNSLFRNYVYDFRMTLIE